jgi:hypothetical protein
MKLCCDVFDWLVSSAGKAGLSIILRYVGDKNTFFLQMRICDADQTSKYEQLPRNIGLPRPLRVAEQQGIKYCPFCGAELSRLIESRRDDMEELVEKHKEFELV